MGTMSFARLWVFFIIVFVSGGSLMGVELIGAKMMAPFYGNTLFVWSAVIGTTLGGLTTGYFIGGYLSHKLPLQPTLHTILLVISVLVASMPIIGDGILSGTLHMGLKVGITLSPLIYLFPPLIGFGMISPIIIRIITSKVELIGRSAGTIYAISTFGGILATFWFGFYGIAYWGLIACSHLIAGVLICFPLLYGLLILVGKLRRF